MHRWGEGGEVTVSGGTVIAIKNEVLHFLEKVINFATKQDFKVSSFFLIWKSENKNCLVKPKAIPLDYA